jgi:branched-chain amino acid transport system substrate-binding protein
LRNRGILAFLAVLAVALPVVLTGCGGGGGGNPSTLKIVSDLPLQGSDRVQTEQMVRAIQFVLDQAGNKAGDYDIEFESNDDATAAAGKWDEAKCSENARNYVDDDSIVGVIGTYNSGCAALEIPILNDASLAMVSPANTYPGLTTSGPGTEAGEPDKYYPTGERNYARVVANDSFQGRVDASYMKDVMGVTKVYILDDRELYGKGVADVFEASANDIGLEVVGHEGWDKDAPNYTALMTKIKATGADGVFFGGVSTNNGGQLIKDKVAVLGDNETVKLMVPDGFILSTLFEEAGAENVNGAMGSAPTKPPEQVSGAGEEFFAEFEPLLPAGQTIQVYAIYAAAAAQVLLDAIARSDGTREDITAKLFETNLSDSVVGELEFDENGDPTAGTESIYAAENGDWVWKEERAVE